VACAIDATVGGDDANSYATIAEADIYHESHPYSAVWDAATSDQKCRALVTATRLLDTWFEWVGSAASSGQRLLWPRDGAYGPNGYLHLTDELPTRIVEATAELARQLLISDRTADSEIASQAITSLRAGSVALTFGQAVAKPVPDSVMAMVSFYGVRRSGDGGTPHLYRA
jgi:hypothetical protein